MASENKLTSELIDFVKKSPTPFHATKEMADSLKKSGFCELKESDSWNLEAGKKYFVMRNESSIIGFTLKKGDYKSDGMRLVGAHTDSPCLKVKPNPEMKNTPYLQLAVEPYGGVLLSTWFDRDLSLAGRVTLQNSKGKIISRLVDFKKPIAVLPNVAIHLDRTANDNRSINKQKDLPPIICQLGKNTTTVNKLLETQLKLDKNFKAGEKILDSELYFYDTQTPRVAGLKGEFINSARLDNLLSCFISMKAISKANQGTNTLIVANDHEECGSSSSSGADGTFLEHVLKRIYGDGEIFMKACVKSMLISADNAHAVHPNFQEKHDENHGPVINGGPVIKVNANQRYATNSVTSSIFKSLCLKSKVPFQQFVARSDMGCGSTIGPVTASRIGMKTIDVGLPTFAMHSIREMSGTKDADYLVKVLVEFFKLKEIPE